MPTSRRYTKDILYGVKGGAPPSELKGLEEIFVSEPQPPSLRRTIKKKGATAVGRAREAEKEKVVGWRIQVILPDQPI